MEGNKDLSQLITGYINSNRKNNRGKYRDEILFYLATTENPFVKLNMDHPLSILESLIWEHNMFHDLVKNEEVEFEGVSSALGISGVFTINVTNNITRHSHNIKPLLHFKTYTIGFAEENPQATLLLNIEYIFNIVESSGDIIRCNLKELY